MGPALDDPLVLWVAWLLVAKGQVVCTSAPDDKGCCG